MSCVWLDIAGIFLFALCSLLLSSGPRCLSSWPVWMEGQFCSWFRSVCSEFPSVVIGTKMLVGMDQKESYAARSSPRSSPTSHFLCWFYWLRYISCCVPLSVGRPVMPGIMSGWLSKCRTPRRFRCCSSSQKVDFPVVPLRLIPMVLVTMEVPVDVPVVGRAGFSVAGL